MKNFLIKVLISITIGAFFSWWVLKNVNLQKLIELSSQVNFTCVSIGVAAYAGAILTRALRWRSLLIPFAPLKLRQVLKVLVVGYAMNVILPLRLGELFRVNICKKWYSISRSTALATIVWERVSDGVIVLVCLILGALKVGNLHNQHEILGLVIGGTFIFSSGVFALLLLRRISLASFLRKFPRAQTRVNFFQKGIQEIPIAVLTRIIIISLVIWVFEGLAFWLIVKATGIHLSIYNTFLLIGVVSLSTLLPSPPGFLGTMQFAFSISLISSGYFAAAGVLAATMTQLFFLGSLTVVGIFLFAWTSLTQRRALHY